MSHAAGVNLGGVRTFDDLRGKSRIDEETACWIVDGHRNRGSTQLWLPAAGKVMSLTAAFAWLKTGAAAEPGRMWVAVCGNTGCGNPEHRQLGDRGLLMRITRPKLSQLHRARIQQAHLKRSRCYSPELHAEILSSPESGKALAERIGVHESVVSKVRRGEAWVSAAPASSVFTLAKLA